VPETTGVAVSETIDPIVVPIARNAEDYREAFGWQRWRSWSWPTMVIMTALLGLYWFHDSIYVLGVFAVLEVVGLTIYYQVSLTLLASRMQKAHAASGEASYTFTASGFDYRSEVQSLTTSWQAINKATETKRSYLLIYANTSFLIIPKACVPAGKVAQLRSLFQQKLAGRVRLLPST
jgi:hypothetical protein